MRRDMVQTIWQKASLPTDLPAVQYNTQDANSLHYYLPLACPQADTLTGQLPGGTSFVAIVNWPAVWNGKTVLDQGGQLTSLY